MALLEAQRSSYKKSDFIQTLTKNIFFIRSGTVLKKAKKETITS